MPQVEANGITMSYEQQGSGEPLLLIPYLTADHACYAFQVAEYSNRFTCISMDLRGTGQTDAPGGEHSTVSGFPLLLDRTFAIKLTKLFRF